MKILAINGSHRKGNIDFMLDILLESAKENGAEICEIKLREAEIEFCNAGDYCCPKTGKCRIKDDMPEIYKKLEEADVLILATPTYFSNVSARMKNFMDRCNPYWFSKKLKGKKAFLIGTGGDGESIKDMLKIMKKFIKILEIKEIDSYSAVAEKAGEVKENPKVIKELKNLGVKLTKQ